MSGFGTGAGQHGANRASSGASHATDTPTPGPGRRGEGSPGMPTRRQFVKATAAAGTLAAVSWAMPAAARAATARSANVIKVGVIGCGGRGTGAAMDMLTASTDARIVAMGDAFADRVDSALAELTKDEHGLADRVTVPPERRFSGFDAYRNVLATDADVVILATPPGFRPQQFAAAIEAGKHVFMEKPVAVCPAGVRLVLDAARAAAAKKRSVVAGTQRRHESCYQQAFERIAAGEIGRVTSAAVYWNQGGLWMNQRRPEWTDTEWQLRNWLYFDWLSGDHIVEQHVHNLDVAMWAMGGPPARVLAMGGRQVRISPDYGHVFDHFACEFEYDDGRRITSQCRQIDGCTSRVEEVIYGTEGRVRLAQFGTAEISGKVAWKWKGQQTNPYVQEHKDLVASVTGAGPYINHGERIAHSTMMAIMGRMSAYTGKAVTWKQAMESTLDLMPRDLGMGPRPTPEVAVPGRTALI